MLTFLSVCSGIEAASVAWAPLGWKAVAFAEIDPFPCAVLTHHYPDVPNLGDMTQIDGRTYRGALDLVVGGTPCQSFSVAGKRGGMADPRGKLAHAFVRLVRDVSPRWVVWENVPGVFSSCEGRDFREFAAALVDCGYHVVWRVLDAQHFGVPQRRRRVFLVGYSGDWRPAAAVLFEPEGLRGPTQKSRKKRAGIAGAFTASAYAGGSGGPGGKLDGAAAGHFVTQALTGSLGNGGPMVHLHMHVRRLTPRYRTLGNSMAVPVMRWIGKRIAAVEHNLCVAHTSALAGWCVLNMVTL